MKLFYNFAKLEIYLKTYVYFFLRKRKIFYFSNVSAMLLASFNKFEIVSIYY